MMEIKNLIEILRGKCAVCKRSSCNGHYWELSSCPATWEAATALEQLQAENGRLKEEVHKMRWIPVEERLPEPNTGDGYWVAKKGPRGNTMMKLAQYSDYGMAMSIDAVTDITWRDWDFTKITNVTHWMPLPKAPKEEKKDD